MSAKNDDITARPAQGRYDLPGGSYEIIETDVSGATGPTTFGGAIGRRVITTYRPAYLSEDETVLACCHHAHEVAKAHGAREVMLEHLVHALVRVPEAAQVLSDRGINVESLKRESAAVISSEIPVDHTMMVAQLRASKDFNTVMHLAAAAASRRDERQLGARDLLDALLRFDAKSRVVRMIRRHAIEGEIDEPVDPLAEVKGLMERYAGEQRDLRLAVNELRNAQVGQSSAALAGLDDRMRGLERSINLLVNSGGGGRSDLGDQLKTLQDTLFTLRNEARASTDRLQLIERAISAGGVNGAGNGQITTLIGDRFLSVQKAMENHRADLARFEQGIGDRIRLMEAKQLTGEPIEALSRKLETLETSLEARLVDNGKLESMLIDRLKAFEQIAASAGANGKPMVLPPGLDTVGDRLQGLERQVSAQRAELQGWQGAMEKELKAIEEMFDLIPAEGAAGSGLSNGQMQALQQSIDAHRAETQRVAISMQERHGTLERLVDQRLAAVGSGGNSGAVVERLAGLERMLTTARTDQASSRGALDGELEQIRKAMMALGNAQQTLSSAIDEWRQNNSGDLSVISNRLAKLEQTTIATTYERQLPPERPMFGGVSNGNGAGVVISAQQPVVPPAPPVSVVSPASVPVAPAAAPGGGLLDRVDRVLAGRVNN